MPVRLQLSRAKGFNLQAWSRETNGLEAVNVARPTKWGNPYRVDLGNNIDHVDVKGMFRSHWEGALAEGALARQSGREALDQLRGKNLACWCKPHDPCHADVLLELANTALPL